MMLLVVLQCYPKKLKCHVVLSDDALHIILKSVVMLQGSVATLYFCFTALYV